MNRFPFSAGKVQVVTSWSGFFFETETLIIKEPHKVYYLPAINDSATKFATVLGVLNRVHDNVENIGLTGSDLVLNQQTTQRLNRFSKNLGKKTSKISFIFEWEDYMNAAL